ncbi:MAG TPA: branched-chain amino acid transaminase [Candidatus Omnitrophota bacterium]|nr:branched-chain amino acid transaminase [Candidatus Omnitrophota bacterium]
MAKEKIWMNGRYLDSALGVVDVSTAALHYGTSIFEGILCMGGRLGNSKAIFRLGEHLDRMFASAEVLNYKIAFSKEDIKAAIGGLVKVNRYQAAYIRPVIFEDTSYLDFSRAINKLNFVILARNINSTIYRWKMRSPVKVMISKTVSNSWPEILTKAKISGKYLNSIVAKREARNRGFDDALLLDSRGYVSEATSANLFMIKDGLIRTPYRKNTLNGVTQNSIMRIAQDLGYTVREENIREEDLLAADEIFLTNTASGVISVSRIDAKKIPPCGSQGLVKYLRSKYIDIITGKNLKYQEWLSFI